MDIKKLMRNKREASQEQLLEKQQIAQKDNIITENATHPQHRDEEWLNEAREKYADLRRWQQDLTPKYKTLFEDLCGYRLDSQGLLIKIEFVNPLMSINGAAQLVNFVKTFDVNTIVSNYQEYGIKQTMRHGVGTPILHFIKDNRKQLGLPKNNGTLTYVYNIVLNCVEPTLNRAWNGGEREVDSKIMRINRLENEGRKDERKGIFK